MRHYKFLLLSIFLALCSFSVLATDAFTMQGSWVSKSGNYLHVDPHYLGKSHYTINDINHINGKTYIRVSLIGGRYINQITIADDNPNYMIIENESTHTFAEYSRI
ncbi:MAG: hypothetical protein E6Z77_05635 [Veillonella sp.]|uniref:hypothetical protein n=1 Tax=Veillonella sp. TaxID=1926307 RepID=UPI00290DAB3B|nr:hypothetical protein [Veillonella sp.]MDU5683854.1 hypothetical protein [Veillonella sp.]MDU5736441.1 hypothetical protein [Veillonella sp.]MDU5834601.1 hypothetical protein [Veillonella sp.]